LRIDSQLSHSVEDQLVRRPVGAHRREGADPGVSWLTNARRRWFVLAVLWTVLLVLGVGGYLQQAREAGLHRTRLDTLYLTLQLATLQFGGGTSNLNWRLEVARFVAPMMAAGTVLQTASLVFDEQLQRMRASRARAHTIVCGLGDPGLRIAIALARSGERVVAIADSLQSPGVSTARRHDISVVLGDPTDPRTLRAARLARASRLVAITASDSTNVDVLAAVRTIKRTNSAALRCAIQLDDVELTMLLSGADLESEGTLRINFFNLHDLAARAWLAENPMGADKAHPMILGLGQLGQSLVLATAQRWASDGFPTQGRLRLAVVDRSASGRWHALRLQHPGIADVCDPVLLDLDLGAPDAAAVDALQAMLQHDPPTWVAVAFEDEALALSAALLVHRSVPAASPSGSPIPIVVRAKAAAWLAGLLRPADDQPDAPFAGMAVFPMLDRTCTVEAVDAGVREQLARALHEDYLASSTSGGELMVPWLQLTDAQREPSRRRVDAIIESLGTLSCEVAPLLRWGAPCTTFAPAEITSLARREHERWRADRLADGWTYAAERDAVLKHNPLLVGWDDLPAAIRAENERTTADLPAMLARAGFEPMRRA
jgi:hypothetical protein